MTQWGAKENIITSIYNSVLLIISTENTTPSLGWYRYTDRKGEVPYHGVLTMALAKKLHSPTENLC